MLLRYSKITTIVWLSIISPITLGQNFNAFYVPYHDSSLDRHISNLKTIVLDATTRGKTDQLQVQRISTSRRSSTGWVHDTYQIFYQGILLDKACIKTHARGEVIQYVTGCMYDTLSDIVTQPHISEHEALQSATSYYNPTTHYTNFVKEDLKKESKSVARKGLVICPILDKDGQRKPRLAYKFHIVSMLPIGSYMIYVDAHTGEVIDVNPLSMNYSAQGQAFTKYSGWQYINTEYVNSRYYLHDINRGNGIYTYDNQQAFYNYFQQAVEISDADNMWTAQEYNNNKKYAALDAHWGAMMVYDYFYDTFGRNGIDDSGTRINQYVHTIYYVPNGPSSPSNAAWYLLVDGTEIVTYGDGGNSPLQLDAFTSVDIVAHEIGHSIAYHAANLENQWESGAINEALGDIWGACVSNYVNLGKNIWLMGEEFFPNGAALRSMSNPKLFMQPSTYMSSGENGYWEEYPPGTVASDGNDFGGVHRNSGVMNYWFYLLCEGGSGINDYNYVYTVTGIGIENAEQIIYNALCNQFVQTTNYSQAALFTWLAATELYGECSPEVQSVTDAWKAVGVPIMGRPDTLDVSEIIHYGEQKTYFATSILSASNIIGNGAHAIYRSDSLVRLQNGFHACEGSNVHIFVTPCENSADPAQVSSRQIGSHTSQYISLASEDLSDTAASAVNGVEVTDRIEIAPINTAIDNVNADTPNGPAYDLLGRPVDDTYHGIVIRDGKKYVQ